MKGRITEKNNIEDTDKNIEKITLKIRLWGRIILRIRNVAAKIQQEKIRFLKR